MRSRRLAALLAMAFVVGMIVQAWRMVRMPLDEYHHIRLEIDKRLEELQREANGDLRRGGRR